MDHRKSIEGIGDNMLMLWGSLTGSLYGKDISRVHILTTIYKNRWLLKVHKIENFFDSDFGICVFLCKLCQNI